MTTIRWGRQAGKQRYKCKNCGILFTDSRPAHKLLNQRIWFEKWIIERLTYRYLSTDSGYSISTLKRLFKYHLSNPPPFPIRQRNKAHLVIDGTYFSNEVCLVLYQDYDIKYTQLYRFSKGEYYEEIREDLMNLKRLGVDIESITCDGKKAILKAIRKVFPNVITQRCIVHIHRMGHIWLRQKPKSNASKELKEILDLLIKVRTNNDSIAWRRIFLQWYNQRKEFINEKSRSLQTNRWWYRHKLLRRATVTVLNALPDMFHYVNNPKIPKSTNSLESFFGHLKDTLSIHRGLSYAKRIF